MSDSSSRHLAALNALKAVKARKADPSWDFKKNHEAYLANLESRKALNSDALVDLRAATPAELSKPVSWEPTSWGENSDDTDWQGASAWVQKPEVDKTQSLGAGLDVIGETVTKFAGRGDAKSSRAIIGGRNRDEQIRSIPYPPATIDVNDHSAASATAWSNTATWHTSSGDIAALDAIQSGNQPPNSRAPIPFPNAQPTEKGAKVVALIHDLLLHISNSHTSMDLLTTELATDVETANGGALFGSVLELERLAQAQLLRVSGVKKDIAALLGLF